MSGGDNMQRTMSYKEIDRARGVQDYLRKKGISQAEWFDEVAEER